MSWIIDLIVIIILILSFIGGMKDGAVKSFFSLIALFIAIPLAGLSYPLITAILSFLPGTNWEYFFGFFITMGIISIIAHIIFFLPRRITQKFWGKGCLFRLLGGVLNTFSASIGMVVFMLVLMTYPIIDWFEQIASSSGVLIALVESYGFVRAMLPEVFQQAAIMVNLITGM
ncbi:CvpA family protein [Chloroflexota bacterium]